MDIDTIKHLLQDAGNRGPDGAETLIAHFDHLIGDMRQQFCVILSDVTGNLLADTAIAANTRDLAFNNAAQVLYHVQKTVEPKVLDEQLRQACMAWIKSHPHNDYSSWFAYGSVLRLLRLTGYTDAEFWRTQFDFWVTQFTESPPNFSLICRCVMQAIRALGATGSLNSIQLGSLFGHGVRAQNFPVHEVYAALEEISGDISGQSKMASKSVKESLFGTALRNATDASSIDAMPQAITPENMAQRDKTLRSWRVHCLSLPAMALVSTTDTTNPNRRSLKASSYQQLMTA